MAPIGAAGPDREMFIRSALHLYGIEDVADFWTTRNRRALAFSGLRFSSIETFASAKRCRSRSPIPPGMGRACVATTPAVVSAR